jgi:prepilin-type N-terminal cleavage/methylation domain-containing protein
MNKTSKFNMGVIIPKRRKMNKTPNFSMSVTKKAFTLIEILIVVAVIGILFITLVPRIDFAGDKARETGVKTDFRAFSLAAEQLLRENAGLAKHDTLAKVCAENAGLNLYLDPALQFSTTGTSNGLDPWNQNYTVQVMTPSSGNVNNGGIIFVSNGKDSSLTTDADNYTIATVFIDGKIETQTSGFSSNIEADSIDTIEASSTGATMTVSSGVASIRYKN